MSDERIDPQEREAMNEAMRIGVKNGTLGETVWLAAREYSKQREEKLREALVEAERMTSLCGGLSWSKALGRLSAIHGFVSAALAENGDNDE